MKVNNNITQPITALQPQMQKRKEAAIAAPSSSIQTEICSKEASACVKDTTQAFIVIQRRERNSVKEDLKKIAEYCSKDANLKKITGEFTDAMSDLESFVDAIESLKITPDFELSKRLPALRELSSFIADSANDAIVEQAGDELLADIVINAKNPLKNISKKMLNNLRSILENPDFEEFAYNIKNDKLTEILFSKTPDLVVEKNIALLADAYKNDNYLQKIDMNNPSLFLYNGDMVKLLQTLKQKVNNLTPEEELTFDYDYTTGETRIHTSYSAGEDLIVKHVDYYDGAMKNTGVSSGIEGRNAMGTKTLNTSFQDFEKGMDYYSKSLYDDGEKLWYPVQNTRIKKDKNGKVLEVEITKPSAMEGVMNVKTIDANGKIHTKISTEKTSKDLRVVKNLVSPDGTVTKVRYIRSNDLRKEAFGYQVTDKDGNILAQKTDYKTRLSDNVTIENINGHHYRISSSADSIKVLDELTGEMSVIDIKKMAPDNTEEFLKFLKKLSAPELTALNEFVSSLEMSEAFRSSFRGFERILSTNFDIFNFEHELGHAKDNATKESILKMASIDKSIIQYRISNDAKLKRIFEEEKRMYDKTFPFHARKRTQYFTGNTPLRGAIVNRMREAIAEANSLTQEIQIPKWITERAMQLQENFPRTIAYLMQHKF